MAVSICRRFERQGLADRPMMIDIVRDSQPRIAQLDRE
jgi:hypothetical protein